MPESASPATPSIFASSTIWFRLGSAKAPVIGPGKLLPLPSLYYAAFAQWHRLSLLKDARTLGGLRQLVRNAERPQEIEDLIHLIEADLGYELYQAISKTKLQLSTAERTTFHYKAGELDIRADVTRADWRRDRRRPRTRRCDRRDRGLRLHDRRHLLCARSATVVRTAL